MNKLAAAFVIAASSVVIAVGGVWLYQKYAAHQALEQCISEEIKYNNTTKNWDFRAHWDQKKLTEKREFVQSNCVLKLRNQGILTQ